MQEELANFPRIKKGEGGSGGHDTRTSSDSSSETNTPVREQKPLPKKKHLEDKNYETSNCGKIKNSPAGLRDTIRECSRS